LKQKAKYLIVIVGPTAVGKTALGIKLASFFKTEILSADSRQVFREMEIGTAKPSPEELSEVKHYFINSHSIYEEFNAGKFEEEGLKVLEGILDTHNTAVMVGGSGLYIDAICKGMDKIPADPEIRNQLIKQLETEGLEKLQEQLARHDPDYFGKVDKQNPQRVMRALEVYLSTGIPYSVLRTRQEVERPFSIIKIGLDLERAVLYERIDKRMDEMIGKGLFREAEKLYPLRHLNALQTVGYSEIFDYFAGIHNKEEAVRLLKRNSRRYAKRQLTWFRRDSSIQWFKPEEDKKINEYISGLIEEKKTFNI